VPDDFIGTIFQGCQKHFVFFVFHEECLLAAQFIFCSRCKLERLGLVCLQVNPLATAVHAQTDKKFSFCFVEKDYLPSRQQFKNNNNFCFD
jgi:hypothetical protein